MSPGSERALFAIQDVTVVIGREDPGRVEEGVETWAKPRPGVEFR